MATKLKKLYEGKAKIIYAKNSNQVIATYKNDATAFNNLKKLINKDLSFWEIYFNSGTFILIIRCGDFAPMYLY